MCNYVIFTEHKNQNIFENYSNMECKIWLENLHNFM